MKNNRTQEKTTREIGDVVWAKVKGYPYWPAKITDEPKKDEQTRRKANKKANEMFVSFFGVGLSFAWVQSKDILPYECEQKEDLIKKSEKQQKLKTAIDDAERFILLNSSAPKLNINSIDQSETNKNGLLSIDEELKLINGSTEDEEEILTTLGPRPSRRFNVKPSDSSEFISNNKSRKRARSESNDTNAGDANSDEQAMTQHSNNKRLCVHSLKDSTHLYKNITLVIDSNYRLTSHLIERILSTNCDRLYIFSLNENEDFEMLKDTRIKVISDMYEAFKQDLIISYITNADDNLKCYEERLFKLKLNEIKYVNLSPQTIQDARFYHSYFNDNKCSYIEASMIIYNNDDNKIKLLAATYDSIFFNNVKYLLDLISNNQVYFKGKYLCLPNLLSSIAQPIILANKMFQIEITRILNQIKCDKKSFIDIGDTVIAESLSLIKHNAFNNIEDASIEFFEDLS